MSRPYLVAVPVVLLRVRHPTDGCPVGTMRERRSGAEGTLSCHPLSDSEGHRGSEVFPLPPCPVR